MACAAGMAVGLHRWTSALNSPHSFHNVRRLGRFVPVQHRLSEKDHKSHKLERLSLSDGARDGARDGAAWLRRRPTLLKAQVEEEESAVAPDNGWCNFTLLPRLGDLGDF